MAKVLVTGGTGFVGSHTVAALLRAGHEVRLLVRQRDRVAAALDPHGVEVADVVTGDVTDADSVQRALDGRDALVHLATVFSFDPQDEATMFRVNVGGTRIVLHSATEAGLDPIIHVSTTLALIPSAVPLTNMSPVGDPEPPYSRSKAEAEHVARSLQRDGAPVIITNPVSVWGPHDPHLGESATLATTALKGQMRLVNDGVIGVVDVRDVADVHARLIDPAYAGRRFILAAHNLPMRELLTIIGRLTGRNLRPVTVPHGASMALGKAMDWLAQRTGATMPISAEPPWILANNAPADASATEEAFGIEWRPLEETIEATLRWLVAKGHVTARQAGMLAAV